jgi:hypothetical protein
MEEGGFHRHRDAKGQVKQAGTFQERRAATKRLNTIKFELCLTYKSLII